jgi:hypothetical protein
MDRRQLVETRLEPLELAIRNHLVAYLAGECSLDEFTDWFVGVSWIIEQHINPHAYALAAAIELTLAEASGLYSRTELREELCKFVNDVPADVHACASGIPRGFHSLRVSARYM